MICFEKTILLLAIFFQCNQVLYGIEYCSVQPIDLVYTWVNGSDQVFQNDLKELNKKIALSFNMSIDSTVIAIIGTDRKKINLMRLKELDERFHNAIFEEYMDKKTLFVYFNKDKDINMFFHTPVVVLGKKTDIRKVRFVDKGNQETERTIIFSNLPHNITLRDIERSLRDNNIRKPILVNLNENSRAAAVHFALSVTAQGLFARRKNFKINGSNISMIKGKYFLLRDGIFSMHESSYRRYADNNELKYSLRSVNKHVNWVRKIYIVTNGQIPKWLNLSNPRVSIVEHADIFVNKTDLPTFSSRAIETHLHRIPGLSRYFISSNDDFFFGHNIEPSDFYTRHGGFQVYLDWDIGKCSPDCAVEIKGDGYCDRSCNTKECAWDLGDCATRNFQRKKFEEGGHIDFAKIVAEQAEKMRREEEAKKIEKAKKKAIIKKLLMNDIEKFKRILANSNSTETDDFVKSFIDEMDKKSKYETRAGNKRVILEAYEESVLYSSNLIDKEFGAERRNFLSHIPVFCDREVITEVQERFKQYFEETSANKLRNGENILPNFIYIYYLIHAQFNSSKNAIFQAADLDESGDLSAQEIIQLTAAIHRQSPIFTRISAKAKQNCEKNFYERNDILAASLRKCSSHVGSTPFTISELEVFKCNSFWELFEDIVKENGLKEEKYKTTVISREATLETKSFITIKDDLLFVYKSLKELKNSMRKFICFNDDLSSTDNNENERNIRKLIREFYEENFPDVSEFELKDGKINKFLHVKEMNECFHGNDQNYEQCLGYEEEEIYEKL